MLWNSKEDARWRNTGQIKNNQESVAHIAPAQLNRGICFARTHLHKAIKAEVRIKHATSTGFEGRLSY